jgi:hypothetical protein
MRLDSGEKAAIILAASLKVDAILMDDRAGVAAARAKGFVVVGNARNSRRCSASGQGRPGSGPRPPTQDNLQTQG